MNSNSIPTKDQDKKDERISKIRKINYSVCQHFYWRDESKSRLPIVITVHIGLTFLCKQDIPLE